MLLFNLLFYYVVSIIVLFICILNFFYDGKINTYICNNFSPSFWYKKYLAYIGTPANAENNCTKLPGFEFTKLGSYTREIMRNITCQWKVLTTRILWQFFMTNLSEFFQYFLFYCKIFFLFLFKLRFTPCKAEQPLKGIELQEKESQKDYIIQEICWERTYS